MKTFRSPTMTTNSKSPLTQRTTSEFWKYWTRVENQLFAALRSLMWKLKARPSSSRRNRRFLIFTSSWPFTMGKLKISTFPSFSSTVVERDMVLIYISGSRSRRNKDTGLWAEVQSSQWGEGWEGDLPKIINHVSISINVLIIIYTLIFTSPTLRSRAV